MKDRFTLLKLIFPQTRELSMEAYLEKKKRKKTQSEILALDYNIRFVSEKPNDIQKAPLCQANSFEYKNNFINCYWTEFLDWPLC